MGDAEGTVAGPENAIVNYREAGRLRSRPFIELVRWSARSSLHVFYARVSIEARQDPVHCAPLQWSRNQVKFGHSCVTTNPNRTKSR